MPQLKKIVLAVGNRMIYADTYDEALRELAGGNPPAVGAQQSSMGSTSASSAGGAPPVNENGALADRIRAHLQRYKELVSQGKMADAGKELDAIAGEVKK
jgi:uncharacterized membrane protein (UPF0182 family)